ncbi:MAG: chemotaxis protein CheW [Desulfobacterales bacterium]|nr:chemotaxis protein CheW [Desulfobacterales bacterium]
MIDQDELLANFVEESQQHLQNIEPDLLDIEKGGDNIESEVVNRVFRAIHSVKGAAGFFGLKKISELTHVMENLLSLLRDKKIEASQEFVDSLLLGVDSLKKMVDDVSSSENVDIEKELNSLNALLSNKGSSKKKFPVKEKTPSDNTVKIFHIPEDNLARYKKGGYFLYSIILYLKEDLQKNNKTPFDFIKVMESSGEFIDANLNLDSVIDLSNCFENELSFVFLYATILEPDLVPLALELPPDRIKMLDYSDYKEQSSKILSHIPQLKFNEPNREEALDVKTTDVIKKDEKEEILKKHDHIEEEIDELKEEPKSDDLKQEKTQLKGRVIQSEEKIRVGVNFLNELVNLAGELVLGRNQLMQIAFPLAKSTSGLNPVLQHISRITTEMQEKIMQMRMQPVSILFGKFHRIVRDLAKNLKKEIKLETFGEDVELDKSIIESLSDPLTHLIRNCVDHGIELPEDREKAGKPRYGSIELKAFHQAGQVHLEVIDDGKGIDGKKVAKKAIEKGLITKEQLSSMTEKDLVKLIFKPGFSTAEQVTSVSGRGVGMDVVVTNIEHLSGFVNIDTKAGKGTKMSLVLPLTLAIVSGLTIKTGGQSFILPEANIDELVRIKPEEIKNRVNIIQDCRVLRLREMLLPLVNLKEILGFSNKENKSEILNIKEPLRILVVKSGDTQFGLIVESVENIEEIVVKPLPRYLKKMKFFSGASIMGNGTVSLIIDVGGLFEKAGLKHLDFSETDIKISEKGVTTEQETQTLLIFDNNTEERFALPLELITRIESVKVSSIERVKDKQFLQYQGKKLRLIFFEDYLPITRPERNKSDTIGVIVPKHMKYPIGIVINKVIGTMNTAIDLDVETIMAPGLFGSAVLDGKITLLPDIYRLFEMAAPEWYQSKTEGTDKKKKKILLVDDTPFFRMVEREYLESAGYEVLEAENGKKALKILEQKFVNGVVLDIVMPEMDGWELIKTIRSDEKLKNLPVLAVSSISDDNIYQKGIEAGFSDWEGKLNKTRLLNKLAAIIK